MTDDFVEENKGLAQRDAANELGYLSTARAQAVEANGSLQSSTSSQELCSPRKNTQLLAKVNEWITDYSQREAVETQLMEIIMENA